MLAGPELGVALVDHLQSRDEQAQVGVSGLCLVFVGDRFADLHEWNGLRVFAHQQVAEMSAKSSDEVMTIESFIEHFVEEHQTTGNVFGQNQIREFEVVIVVEYVEVLNNSGVSKIASAEGNDLIEDGKGITHGTVGFGGDHVQCFRFGLNAFFRSDGGQVVGDVFNLDSVEVEDLATAENGRYDLVFLGCCQDEDGVCRRFFKRLEESVEGGRRQHVNLVDDVDLELARLRRDAHAVDNATDVIHAVVGGCIEFEDVELHVFELFAQGAVDGLGEYACAGGFTNSARSCEQVSLSNLLIGNGALQRRSDVFLSYNCFPAVGAVFSCRNDELLCHRRQRWGRVRCG